MKTILWSTLSLFVIGCAGSSQSVRTQPVAVAAVPQGEAALTELWSSLRPVTISHARMAPSSKGIKANDRVDVIGKIRDSKTRGFVDVTLLQDVTVVSISEPTSGRPSGTRSLTVSVLPEDAELLGLASSNEPLVVSVRQQRDVASAR
jgi:Flp pilus assembly protein CpaB